MRLRLPNGRTAAAITFVALSIITAACARHPKVAPSTERIQSDSTIRVVISLTAPRARISASALLIISDGARGTTLGTSSGGAVWDVIPHGADGFQLSRSGAGPIVVRGTHVVLRSGTETGFVMHEGRRYRGLLTLHRDPAGVIVINSLGLEDYLKGVVPLEIGNRASSEAAAVAAQSVAARSFTLARLATRRRDRTRRYDFVADVSDQMYGGRDSELPLTTSQVDATRGMVLLFAGRVIEAVYSSSCGGSTTDASDAWSGPARPYLASVSDAIPGTAAFYCDIAPRFAWHGVADGASLQRSLETYVRSGNRSNGTTGRVESIEVTSRSQSGRAKTLTITTSAGRYEVSGDAIRFALRLSSGEALRSTMFELEAAHDSAVGVVRVDFKGRGYGHGVGLCQWGAIGRARAGQNFRQILDTYYPGTSIQRVENTSGIGEEWE